MQRETKIFILVIAVMLLLTVGVNAIIVNWSVPVGIVVQATSIGVYWESGGSEPVESIDFGTVTKGAQTLYKYMYIENEGTGTAYVYWNSTLSSVTGEITESWFTNGTGISAGSYIREDYRISLSQDIPVGTYNWTLCLWAT